MHHRSGSGLPTMRHLSCSRDDCALRKDRSPHMNPLRGWVTGVLLGRPYTYMAYRAILKTCESTRGKWTQTLRRGCQAPCHHL
eukprot:7995036-Alexandrium_andersonii.AAC.1